MLDASPNTGWVAIGLLGNGVYAARFRVQWQASERAGRRVVPPSFWFLSLVGSGLLLAYALVRRERRADVVSGGGGP
jgi:lipid-A-disaccharide synthase-like uncharacterized protein